MSQRCCPAEVKEWSVNSDSHWQAVLIGGKLTVVCHRLELSFDSEVSQKNFFTVNCKDNIPPLVAGPSQKLPSIPFRLRDKPSVCSPQLSVETLKPTHVYVFLTNWPFVSMQIITDLSKKNNSWGAPEATEDDIFSWLVWTKSPCGDLI